MWMPLFSVQGVPNTLQSIPRLNIAKQIFKMRVYQVYSHAYWLTIFWTTNCSPGIEVAFENFGKNFNFSWTPCICELMCPQCDFIMVYLINRFLISVRTDNGGSKWSKWSVIEMLTHLKIMVSTSPIFKSHRLTLLLPLLK